MNLVRHTISVYYPNIQTSDEDAFQEGMIGLIFASRSYDSSLGAFSTFAVRCIRNQLNKYMNSMKKCCDLDDKYISLDDDNKNDHTAKNSELFFGSVDVDYYNILERDFIDHLSEGQAVIVNLAIQGVCQSDIARKIGYSKQYVSKEMKIIRSKFDSYIYGKVS